MRIASTSLALLLCCAVSLVAQPEYQLNSSALSIDIGGVTTDGNSPAVWSSNCAPVTGTFNLSTDLPYSVYEIAISAAAQKPGSMNYIAPTGEIVNLDIFQPITWMWGGSSLAWWPFYQTGWPGTNQTFAFSVPFTASSLFISLQGVVADPAAASGITLSQACTADVSPAPGTVIPGFSDDGFMNVVLANNVTFYGTIYSDLNINANGRVMFGGGDTDWSPSVADILGDNPSVGYFTDLSPDDEGCISIEEAATELTVYYNGVRYFSEAGNVNSFSISFDLASGDVTLGGLGGIAAPAAANEGALCLSAGLPGAATDAGATLFTAGGSGSPVLPTDAWYDGWFDTANVGLTPTLDPGVNASIPSSIVFSPALGGGYSWAGF